MAVEQTLEKHQGFGRDCRLLTAAEYKAVFDRADWRVSRGAFLILARLNQKKQSRLGLVVAKKHLKLATQRNRVKRLVRESFRTHQCQLPNCDLIFLARKDIGHADNRQLLNLLSESWNKLERLSRKKNSHKN